MSKFEPALEFVFDWEGGYVNDKNDKGGPTNFGISQRFLDSHPYKNILHAIDLTKEDAEYLYKKYFWDTERYADIDNQLSANLVFSMSVNAGPYQSHLLAQWACLSSDIVIDGKIGSKTIERINELDFDFIPAFRAEIAHFYRNLVSQNTSMARYLKGWLRRAYGEK